VIQDRHRKMIDSPYGEIYVLPNEGNFT